MLIMGRFEKTRCLIVCPTREEGRRKKEKERKRGQGKKKMGWSENAAFAPSSPIADKGPMPSRDDRTMQRGRRPSREKEEQRRHPSRLSGEAARAELRVDGQRCCLLPCSGTYRTHLGECLPPVVGGTKAEEATTRVWRSDTKADAKRSKKTRMLCGRPAHRTCSKRGGILRAERVWGG